LSRKIRENKFTIDEILLILEIIQPEQYQFEMLTQNIKIAEEQFRNGEFVEEEDFVFDVDTIYCQWKMKIRFSRIAQLEYDEIIKYLFDNFGKEKTVAF